MTFIIDLGKFFSAVDFRVCGGLEMILDLFLEMFKEEK